MKFLREQRAAGKSFGVIAKLLGKSERAIRNKCKHMGLDDNDQENLRS
jgi:hypothetical protein